MQLCSTFPKIRNGCCAFFIASILPLLLMAGEFHHPECPPDNGCGQVCGKENCVAQIKANTERLQGLFNATAQSVAAQITSEACSLESGRDNRCFFNFENQVRSSVNEIVSAHTNDVTQDLNALSNINSGNARQCTNDACCSQRESSEDQALCTINENFEQIKGEVTNKIYSAARNSSCSCPKFGQNFQTLASELSQFVNQTIDAASGNLHALSEGNDLDATPPIIYVCTTKEKSCNVSGFSNPLPPSGNITYLPYNATCDIADHNNTQNGGFARRGHNTTNINDGFCIGDGDGDDDGDNDGNCGGNGGGNGGGSGGGGGGGDDDGDGDDNGGGGHECRGDNCGGNGGGNGGGGDDDGDGDDNGGGGHECRGDDCGGNGGGNGGGGHECRGDDCGGNGGGNGGGGHECRGDNCGGNGGGNGGGGHECRGDNCGGNGGGNGGGGHECRGDDCGGNGGGNGGGGHECRGDNCGGNGGGNGGGGHECRGDNCGGNGGGNGGGGHECRGDNCGGNGGGNGGGGHECRGDNCDSGSNGDNHSDHDNGHGDDNNGGHNCRGDDCSSGGGGNNGGDNGGGGSNHGCRGDSCDPDSNGDNHSDDHNGNGDDNNGHHPRYMGERNVGARHPLAASTGSTKSGVLSYVRNTIDNVTFKLGFGERSNAARQSYRQIRGFYQEAYKQYETDKSKEGLAVLGRLIFVGNETLSGRIPPASYESLSSVVELELSEQQYIGCTIEYANLLKKIGLQSWAHRDFQEIIDEDISDLNHLKSHNQRENVLRAAHKQLFLRIDDAAHRYLSDRALNNVKPTDLPFFATSVKPGAVSTPDRSLNPWSLTPSRAALIESHVINEDKKNPCDSPESLACPFYELPEILHLPAPPHVELINN